MSIQVCEFCQEENTYKTEEDRWWWLARHYKAHLKIAQFNLFKLKEE